MVRNSRDHQSGSSLIPLRVSRPSTSEDVKFFNRSAIFKIIREQHPISRVKIARTLHLSPSTVSRQVEELMAMGLVVEGTERGQSTRRGGRRSIPLQVDPSAGYLIGVDLGGTTIEGGLANLGGEILAHRSVPSRSPTGEGGEESLRRLTDLIQELVQACPDPAHIWGVGIGAPAVTHSQIGLVTWAPALGWRDLPLKQILENTLGLPVFVDNDANLAALGEHQNGAGRGVNDLVTIFVGTGIGAGIIINGQLHRGATYAAGEVGYMVVDTASLGKRYDTFGCLETLASGTGIANRARKAIETGRQTSLLALAGGDPNTITAELVFEAARQGDHVARSVVDETVQYLSLAVVNITCLLNPELIVIGGGVAGSADILLEAIRRQIDGVAPEISELKASALGKDAIIMGALATVMREVSEVAWRVPGTESD